MPPSISQIARHAFSGPRGDKSRHLSMEELEHGFAKLEPPRDRGTLALIVSRGTLGKRSTPDRVRLTPEGGVPGDTWFRESPSFFDAQLAVMRVDVCRLVANGQAPSMPGDNLLIETPASGAANIGVPGTQGVGTILQGFLETSNVNPVAEITTLITAQRAYEMNSRVITASDEMLRTITNLR